MLMLVLLVDTGDSHGNLVWSGPDHSWRVSLNLHHNEGGTGTWGRAWVLKSWHQSDGNPNSKWINTWKHIAISQIKSFGKELALMTYQEPAILAWFPLSHTQMVVMEATDFGPVTIKPAEGRDFVPDFLGLLCHHSSEGGILEIGYLPFISL